MSYRHQDIVFELRGINSSEKLVLLALAYRANDDGVCWPSLDDISQIGCMNVKTVRKALKDLVQKGLLIKEEKAGKSCVFTMNLDGTTPPKIGTTPLPDLAPLPKTAPLPDLGVHPYQNREVTPTKFGARTNKEQVIEQVIVKETNKESSEDFEAPLSEQIENAQLENCESDIEDPDHVLTSIQMVVLGKTLGVKLSNTIKLQEIANRQTITVELFKDCVAIWKRTAKGTGYLMGILRNASLNPETVKPEQPKYDKEALRGFFEDCGLHDF